VRAALRPKNGALDSAAWAWEDRLVTEYLVHVAKLIDSRGSDARMAIEEV
jgi:hypothetical protein